MNKLKSFGLAPYFFGASLFLAAGILFLTYDSWILTQSSKISLASTTESLLKEQVPLLYLQSILVQERDLENQVFEDEVLNSKKNESLNTDELEPKINSTQEKIMEKKIYDTEKTLTNEEIELKIASKKNLFHKCQTLLIKNQENSKGSVLLSIEISQKGRITKLSLLDSEFKNQQFHDCIQSTLHSLRWRSFKGSTIQAQLPLQFD